MDGDDGWTSPGGSSPASVSFLIFSVSLEEQSPQNKQLATNLISAKHAENV